MAIHDDRRGEFPQGFFWGAATASYQVEGGIENCDWAEAARQNRVPRCGRACDHYRLYEADFDLLKSLGHNSHRISIEWARIEPVEGQFDEAEIEHYCSVVKALRARGIEPFVTLWHFTLPIWFVERGGWLQGDSDEIFARYAVKIASALQDDCVHFATMNEPMVYSSNGWVKASWPPFKNKAYLEYWRINKRLIKAHCAAYDAVKESCPKCDVGIVKHNVAFHVAPHVRGLRKFFYEKIASVKRYVWNHWFLKNIVNHCDSIGLNYYFHNELGQTTTYPRSDMGWELYPDGIYILLMELKRYNKWVFVSECGLADEADVHRAWYIRECVRAMRRAIDDGVDLRGYMHWSLLDNYEWAFGFEKRFGLIGIDYDTLVRTPRPSAYEYKKIIERNGAVDLSDSPEA